ncbi:MAG: aminodeoxychorismate/anthranilate synthase component II [Solirubrobacterales bacterium]|nr:aminodeoxychorismate/anthranilate synthase component II [Solirubrobacterales bacterium]
MKVLIIDNYDSFTYNLVQYLGELGAEIEVVRNDAESIEELQARSPDRVVVSPGPCTPNEAGVSLESIKTFAEAGVPVLGVCLGHQALGQVFGGEVVRGTPTHGKTALVVHDGKTIFADVESPIEVARYHSLVVKPETLPDVLEVSATTNAPEGKIIMGLRHKELPAQGVQFHPESILTGTGLALLANFLRS